jgi:HAD superfamily hydrolase (TIGR01450 family)
VRLDDCRGFVFDVDGTLVHRAGGETHVQPGALEVFAKIRASGRPLAVFTNGTHETPAAFAAGLREVGFGIADEELLTPLRSVLTFLRGHDDAGSVILLGNDAARDYLVGSGVRILPADADEQAAMVFVATPDALQFEELERAARAVLAGARLLTGSYAPAYAGANGPIISRGAMTAAALAKASGTEPVIVGKPSRTALATISKQLGAPAQELAVIGDDLGMDIALGRLAGARTILVRSGISGEIDLDQVPEEGRPDAVVESVAEVLDWL